MTISFTGLGSGMDYSSWIDALVEAKKANLTTIENKITATEAAQTALSELKSSFTSFNSTLTTFTDSNLISAFDIFGRRQVTSSDEGKTVSATVSNDATIQSFELNVLQLATSTVATGNNGLGKLADFDKTTITSPTMKLRDIANGIVDNGDVSISVGDETKTFTIDDDTSINDFIDFLTSQGEYAEGGELAGQGCGFESATLNSDGTLSFIKQASQGAVVIGSDDDTSNFLDILGFPSEPTDETFTSQNPMYYDASTKLMTLNNGVITAGEISLYVNNERKTFSIDEHTTINEFKDFLLSEGKYADTGAGLQSVDISANGTFSFTVQDGQNVCVGTTADTSNLFDFFGFRQNADNPQTYASSKILTEIDTSGKILSSGNIDFNGVPLENMSGQFKIGNETFTVDSNTSISGLIYQINSNADAGVTASYDAVANRLVLTAKDPGATSINVEAVGECRFTDAVGWTTNGTTLAEGSQVLGQNSKFKINDQEFEAASNSVSDDVTGISGLTLTFNQLSKDEPTQISITSDYTEVETAIESFIEKYNALIADIKEASSSDGTLAYDSSLRRMITEMANTVMNAVPGLNTYITFSSVGISTGAANADVSDVSQDLVFNKAKFEEAMAKNPNEVKKLFVNEDTADQSNSGVMVKLQNLVEGYKKEDGTKVYGYLDFENGYFAIKSDSYATQLETLNDSLTRKQALIEEYRERLETQFQNMDSYISTMQSYSNYLTSALSSSSSSS